MALRNLKKSMKPLIAVFVVAFILTIVAGLFGSFGALTGGNYALKLNGKKVDIVKIEKAFQMGINNFTQQYGESVNAEELNKEQVAERVKELNPRLICLIVYGQNVNAGTVSMGGAVYISNYLKEINISIDVFSMLSNLKCFEFILFPF